MSISQFAPATISYTSFGGKQCALPSLTDAYGLYYNKKMFAKAGITSPPKTMTELAADAKKLTVRNPDGSIKVAGFVPLNQWEELDIADLGNAFGATWFDKSGKAQLANEPGWTAAFEWQKQLVDWYGYSNLEKFFATYTNSEFNATNAFETGKVAMVFDGEWRTAFIKRDHPTLDYGTAPFPVADNQPQLYGSGRVGGTIVGIPQGTKHPQEAWDLVKYLATDTNYLVTLANSAGNVPTTTASGNSRRTSTWGRSSRRSWISGTTPSRRSTRRSRRRVRATPSSLTTSTPSGRRGTSPTCRPGSQKLDTNIDNQLQLGGQTP